LSEDFTALLRSRAFSFVPMRLIWDLIFATRKPRLFRGDSCSGDGCSEDRVAPATDFRREESGYRAGALGVQLGEVLDDRERVIEVMEQRPPSLVFGRSTESVDVVLERFPLDEKQVAARVLKATLEPQRCEAGLSLDERPSAHERGLKVSFKTGPDVEERAFEDHAGDRPRPIGNDLRDFCRR
jgi:hypothetical protein